GGAAPRRAPPSLHRARGGRCRRAARQRPHRGQPRIRHGPQRQRDRRRLDPHPPSGDAVGGVRPARDRCRGTAGQVRLPARRTPLRGAAARRHRLRHRPDRGVDGGHGIDPRRDRLPQDHHRAMHDDRCAVADRRCAAGGAAHRRAPEGRLTIMPDRTAPTGRAPPGLSPMAPTIRRALPADAGVLSRLAARTFTETFGHLYPPEDLQAFIDEAYAEDRQRQVLSHPDYGVWLLEDGGEAVGHAAVGPCGLPHPEVAPGDGELKRLYLMASHQSAGWGGRLFDTAMGWLERDGPRTLWIGVWS